MTFDEYQKIARTTAIYKLPIIYPVIGLAGEVGEVSEKIKKHIRDDNPLSKEDMTKELGDVLWYISAIAGDLDISLQDIAETNIKKLLSRQERNVLQGSGDNR